MSAFAKVIQLSDFHFGRKLTQEGRAFYTEPFLLAKAKPHSLSKLVSLARKFDEIQRRQGQFDVVLGTGDLATDGSAAALGWCRKFLEEKEIRAGQPSRAVTRGLGVPDARRILIPGNHDRFDRAWIGMQMPTAAFEKRLKLRSKYPYVVGYRKEGMANVANSPAVLFFVFDSTPSAFASLLPWNRIARGRLGSGDCDSFMALVQELNQSGTVTALDGTQLHIRYANCVRIAILHHHPLDDEPTTLMENSDEFMRYCLKTGMHLVLFGHDHLEFWNTRFGFSEITEKQDHKTTFFCCPSASEYSSDSGFYVFDLEDSGVLFSFYKWDDRSKAFASGSLDENNQFVRGALHRIRFSHSLQ